MPTIIEEVKIDVLSQLQIYHTLDYNQLVSIYQKHFPKARKTNAAGNISRIVSELDRDGKLIAEFDKRLSVNQVRIKPNL
jgi:hypothetical protein